MSQKGKEIRRHVQRALEELDIETYTFAMRGKHQEVVFTYNKQTLRYVFAGSPSDRRSIVNTVVGVRRLARSALAQVFH